MYSGLQNVTSSSDPHLGGNLDHGDPYTYCPSCWKYLIGRFALSSVMDLGSGTGEAAQYFYANKLKVIAVDGLTENVSSASYPTLMHDLTKAPVITKVDLVHCQEVVEHIEEQFLDNLIKSFRSGKIVCMTHAFPGQGGHHHVNEQPTEYWIHNLSNSGFSLLVEDTNRIRKLAQNDGAIYLAKSGLVFANNNWQI